MEVLWNILWHLKAFINFSVLLNCYSYTLQKMFNLDDITNENNKDHYNKQPYIQHHRYRMLITDVSGSGKTNALLHLIKNDNDIIID